MPLQPVLIYEHGQDSLTPPQDAELLYALAGGPKRLYYFDEFGHAQSQFLATDFYIDTLDTFLTETWGPVDAEENEPVFHGDWEKRIFALTLAAGALGQWNIDRSRSARESQPPAQYLANSYYQTWLAGLETLLVSSGLLTAEELASGKAAGPLSNELAGRVLRREVVEPAMRRGDNFRMDEAPPAAFQVGHVVCAVHRPALMPAPRRFPRRSWRCA